MTNAQGTRTTQRTVRKTTRVTQRTQQMQSPYVAPAPSGTYTATYSNTNSVAVPPMMTATNSITANGYVSQTPAMVCDSAAQVCLPTSIYPRTIGAASEVYTPARLVTSGVVPAPSVPAVTAVAGLPSEQYYTGTYYTGYVGDRYPVVSPPSAVMPPSPVPSLTSYGPPARPYPMGGYTGRYLNPVTPTYGRHFTGLYSATIPYSAGYTTGYTPTTWSAGYYSTTPTYYATGGGYTRGTNLGSYADRGLGYAGTGTSTAWSGGGGLAP